MSFIYRMTNTINGKFYVGSTTSVLRRMSQHIARLNGGKHHSKHLQSAWNKYGKDAFTFEILEVVHGDIKRLRSIEQIWIDSLNACDPKIGYNKASKVSYFPGAPHTESSRKSMSLTRLGQKTPARIAALRRLAEFNRGKKHDPERIERIRQANKGRIVSSETRRLISEKLKGHKHLPETKIKIANASRGRKHSDATKEKCAAWQRGVPKPRAQVERQRAAMIGKYLGADRYNAKAVVQLTLDGSVVAIFEAGAVAARAVGCHNTAITKVIKGRLNQTGGFLWRRVDQLTPDQRDVLNSIMADKDERIAA